MEKSLEERLSSRLMQEFGSQTKLKLDKDEERFSILDNAGNDVLDLLLLRGEWTVSCPLGHAHVDDFERALDLVVALLSGEARFAQEYRGETLAETWIEIWDTDAFVSHYGAVFLSPFEQDEWTLSPGEEWRIVRTVLRLGEGGLLKEEIETPSPTPFHGLPKMASWIETALGPPVEGMRWRVGGQNRFVFQAPSGWRRRTGTEKSEHQFVDFGSPIDELAFRARAYFRPAEPKSVKINHSVRPSSVQFRLESPSETDPNWTTYQWTLLFSDGEEEMMGILELFRPLASTDPIEDLMHLIESSVGEARFVPHEWQMGDEPANG